MANDTFITIVGNLTNDPELRFTPSGAAVASFTVASTPRHFDKQTSEWVDDEPLFMRCTVWRQYAENVAESLVRGMPVFAYGRLKQRSYETREGEKRTVYELQVEEVGPLLKWGTVKYTRSARTGGYAGPADESTPPMDDPWGSAPPAGAPAGGAGFTDEPPF